MTIEQLQQRAVEIRAAIRDFAYVDRMSREDTRNKENLKKELAAVEAMIRAIENEPVRKRTFASFAGQSVDDACRRIREHFAERNKQN